MCPVSSRQRLAGLSSCTSRSASFGLQFLQGSTALHGPPKGEELVEHGSNLFEEGDGEFDHAGGSNYVVYRPQNTNVRRREARLHHITRKAT